MEAPEGVNIEETKSTGEEFIEWAEKYWRLDELIKVDKPDVFAGEQCNYNYIRKVFIKKIDSIIKDRLGI